MIDDDLLKAGVEGRNIEIGIETSYNFPPASEIHSDIADLKAQAGVRRDRIRQYRKSIKMTLVEQEELRELVKDPGMFDAEACAASAERCNAHIKMYEATIEKELAGVKQLDTMIETLEDRICLQEKMSQ